VRAFGFSSWSVLLPSVLCGATAVGFLMATVRRPWGRGAGLAAGVVFALTPMVVAVSRSNNPDMTLVLMLVVAAWATQRAIEDGRTRWIVLAGVFCGFGFLTKLLAAGLVMPGMYLAYLLAAPGSVWRRVRDLAFSVAAFLIVSLAWVAAVDLRPLGDRPWTGGSTDGSAWDLVFGYNGFGRVTGASQGPGGAAGGFPTGGRFGGGGGIDQFGGAPGLLRLFNAGMGDQVMWFFPIALVSAIAGIVGALRRRVVGSRMGSIVMWVSWAVVVYFVFAFADGIYHDYYVAELAPALGALVGIGVAQVREARVFGRIVAAGAIVATVVLQIVLLDRVDAWTWLRAAVPVVIGVALVGGAILLWRSGGRWVLIPLAVVAAGMLAAPAAWSLAGVQHAQQGTFPDARPSVGGAARSFPGGFPGAAPVGGFPGGGGAPSGGAPSGDGGFPGGGGGNGISKAELTWLRKHQGGARWILGVSSSMQAASAIIDGESVVALGGFSGGDLAATPKRVAGLVEQGELRYLAGGDGGFGGQGGLSTAVASACTPVSAEQWGSTGTSGLYDCNGRARQLRAAKPSSGSRGTPSGAPAANGRQGGLPGGDGIDITKVQACFKQHGVKVENGGTPNFNDPKIREALQACLGGSAGAVPPGSGPPSNQP
jgi:4-amino-4-deoxy-L-arabinose transferase-like glycosyltransferase